MQKVFSVLVTGVQNGVDISVGKLMVYTGAAGIDPSMVLPLVIDAGTNREELRNNPNYLEIVTNVCVEIVIMILSINLSKLQNVFSLNSTSALGRFWSLKCC